MAKKTSKKVARGGSRARVEKEFRYPARKAAQRRKQKQAGANAFLMAKSKRVNHGGPRARAGRPPKMNKEAWGQITCVLRNDTIERLREGAGSRRFGDFLQDHLDRYPPPSREQYRTLQRRNIPVPRARKYSPWDDPALSAGQRLELWAADAAEKHAYLQAERRANLAALGLSEKEIAARLRSSHEDLAGKTRPRRKMARKKR